MSEVAPSLDDTSIFSFEEGIIGVPRARRFQLLEREDSAVKILRCIDIEGFSLPVVDPLLADPEYSPRLGPRVMQALGVEQDDPVLVLAVATLEGAEVFANLKAPVVVNVRQRQALQVILDGRDYALRAPVAVSIRS